MFESDSPLPTHRRERQKSLIAGGISAGAARAVGAVCGLVTVPLALRILGTEGFGVWAALQGAAGLIVLLDFGSGYRLQNHLATASAGGRLADARRDARTVFWLSSGFAILAALVALGGRELWLDLFGIKSVTLRRELGPWLGPMLAFNCATLPASLGLRLAAGLQWTWLVGVAQAAVSVATLVVATICTWQQVSPVWFMGLALALPILVTGGLTVSLLRGLPRGVSYGQPPTLQELNAWWRAGLPFLVPQVAGSLRLTAPPLLLAALLGADAVTPYNLVQRLLSLIAQPQGWLLEPLWPAYADAAARGDHLWIRHTLRWSLASSVVFTIVPLLTVPWWGPAFIEWWTHYRAVAIPLGLLWSLTLWQAGLTLVQPLTYCLNGLGRMRGQTLYGPPCVVVSLAGMAWVAATQGLSLAAAPAAVVTFLVNVPCSIGDVRLAMRNWTPDHTPA